MRRYYFERERATALAVYDANGGNVFRTSNETGVPQSTIRDWIREPDGAASQQVRLEEKRVLREILESIAVRCALALDTDLVVERLARRPQQLAVVLGIVVDKLQLMGSIPKDPSKMTITQLYAEAAEVLDSEAERSGEVLPTRLEPPDHTQELDQQR